MTDETRSEGQTRKQAEAAFDRLINAYPRHADVIRSLMWMGTSEGHDHFKHRHSRKSIQYNLITCELTGKLETGEDGDDANEIMREVAII